MIKNSENAVKKTTNKIVTTADDSGTRCLDHETDTSSLKSDYVNEMHVADFMNALAYDPMSMDAEHISAWTDALPGRSVRQNVDKKLKKSKCRLKQQEAAKPNGISYSLLRYPLIVIILLHNIHLKTHYRHNSISLVVSSPSNLLLIFHYVKLSEFGKM
jgi:hypothetical protein